MRSQPETASSDLIRRTYATLREWYQTNATRLLDLAPKSSGRATSIAKSLPAIQALPPEPALSDLEIRVVLFQVTSGVLNWSSWDSVDGRAVCELVSSTLREAGLPKEVAAADRKAFRESESELRAVFPNI